jgi:hypothetical protein
MTRTPPRPTGHAPAVVLIVGEEHPACYSHRRCPRSNRNDVRRWELGSLRSEYLSSIRMSSTSPPYPSQPYESATITAVRTNTPGRTPNLDRARELVLAVHG